VTGNAKLRNQDIETKIQAMYRHKDKDGEWLTYHVTLYGFDWENNRISFPYTEGKTEGFPIFHRRVDPQTDEIVPGSTTILELRDKYNIPFSKQKVEELSEHFSDIIQFIVKEKGAGGRRLSCSRQQFTDLEFDELIAELTDYMHSDWYKTRRSQQQQQTVIANK
jgi:hypothetical protein